MEAWRAARIIVALLASFSLASCADSGGGIGGTGYVSNGTITAFGSIVVNDVEFDTRNAEVIIGGRSKGAGNQAVLENLDVGQAVVVEGTENDDGSFGTATRVRFTPHVKGPVAQINHNEKRIVVLGQTIITDDSTVFKDLNGTITINDLAFNNLIEVSGLVENMAGAIRATHVRKIADSFDPSTEVEVKGVIRDLDSGAQTFRLNGLGVYYGLAAVGSLPDGTPRSGQWVHVMGRVAGGTLEATVVELADEARIANADRVVLEGFITDFVSTSDFMVGNMQVQAGGDTNFVRGQKEDLAAGVRILVRGRLMDGVLQAQQIIFRK